MEASNTISSNLANNKSKPMPELTILQRLPNVVKEENYSQFDHFNAFWIKEENDQYLIKESTSEVNLPLKKHSSVKYENIPFESVKDDLHYRGSSDEADSGLHEHATINKEIKTDLDLDFNAKKYSDDYLIQPDFLSHDEVDIKIEDEEDKLESKLINYDLKPILLTCPEHPSPSNRKDDIEQYSVKSLTHSYETSKNEISQDHFKRHQINHQDKDTKRWHKCPECSYKTIYKHHLPWHIIIHKPADQIQWFRCLDCSFKTSRKTSLRKHMKTHRTADQQGEDVKVCHKCPECAFKTIYKSSLKEHAIIHKPADQISWISCLDCSFKTNRERSLRKHVKTHKIAQQGKKAKVWHTCPECPYKAIRKHHLQSHALIHKAADQIQWFHCFKCSYKSNRKDNLRNHVKTHRTADSHDEGARV